MGTNSGGGWRLDIVSLLAVIGESSIEEHSQALTSSWTCILPRIIPAPQVLLKPARPTRMPQISAAVVGVYNGTLVPTLNYFPNIIHPIEELSPFAFRVMEITHRKQTKEDIRLDEAQNDKIKEQSSSTSVDLGTVENGGIPRVSRRQTTFQAIAHRIETIKDKDKPRVPPRTFSPLNILSVLSFLVTIGLLIGAIFLKDGTAIVALGTISAASSIVGYASWWQPILMKRAFKSVVPPGDVIIRTREGAFLLVKCNEDVARELYTGTEECQYYVKTQRYRILVGFGTFLLMVSVVLLGNCNFAMQAAIGLSYIILNGSFWGASLIPRDKFWDLSNYDWKIITPDDSLDADKSQGETLSTQPSFTRTMWYAIRETKKIGWIKRGGIAPSTEKWDRWLEAAEQNAVKGNRAWNAVEMREKIVGQAESTGQSLAAAKHEKDTAEQHVPAIDVPLPETR
jgi:hypothetical protein